MARSRRLRRSGGRRRVPASGADTRRVSRLDLLEQRVAILERVSIPAESAVQAPPEPLVRTRPALPAAPEGYAGELRAGIAEGPPTLGWARSVPVSDEGEAQQEGGDDEAIAAALEARGSEAPDDELSPSADATVVDGSTDDVVGD